MSARYLNNSSAVAEMGDRARAKRAEKWCRRWLMCPFPWGGSGSPSNAMWPGPRPTYTPSGILIHSTVWPQYTSVTSRQTDRTTVR